MIAAIEQARTSVDRPLGEESVMQHLEPDSGQTSARLAEEAAGANPLDPYIYPTGEDGELPPGMVLPEPEDQVLDGSELPDPEPEVGIDGEGDGLEPA